MMIYVGNFNKIDKVVGRLSQFGISKEKAGEAYLKIVEKKLKIA